VIAACAASPAQIDQPRLPVFQIDTQGRTPYEIGAELGRQWKKRFPQLESKLDALLKHRLQGMSFPGGSSPDNPTVPPDLGPPDGLTDKHRKELEGLMSRLHLVSRNRLGDGFLSRDELFLVQRLPDLGACDGGSGFGVYASRSDTGTALVGRNLDGRPWPGPMERALAAITVYRGEDRSLVNIGFAGKLGVTTGFNQSGLFLAYLPISDRGNRAVTEGSSEPVAFSIRRVLETHEDLDTAFQALSWAVDDSNYSILMADRERVAVLEHAVGKRGRLRDPSSIPQPAMSWRQPQKIAVVGCFALNSMPSGCISLRDQYRWQRFRTLADLDVQRTPFTLRDIVRIMLDRVGSRDAIFAPTTYQVLAFDPGSAELYLGTPSGLEYYPVEPLMHRYADLIIKPAQEHGGIHGLWILLWLLVAALIVVTLWVRLRLYSPTPSPDGDK